MKVASIFFYNPCTGWSPKDRHDYDKRYSCTDAFTDEFCTKEKMKLIKKEVDCLGGVFVIHLELKSLYSITHPESNQACYKAEMVMYTNY